MIDMASFKQALDAWHPFYIATATLSATLVGLLFVAISLNLNMLLAKHHASTLRMARRTFEDFVCVMFVSLAFLIPQMPPATLGIFIAVWGGVTLAITLYSMLHHRGAITRGSVLRRQITSLCGYGVLIYIGVVLATEPDSASAIGILYFMTTAIFLLLINACRCAWFLLISIHETARESVSGDDEPKAPRIENPRANSTDADKSPRQTR